jgi:hypothetical protein
LAKDQSAGLQAAIDTAAERRVPLVLASGRYLASGLVLRPGTVISGSGTAAVLALVKPGVPLLIGKNAPRIALHDIALDGNMLEIGGETNALVALTHCQDLSIFRLEVTACAGRGASLHSSGGRILQSRFSMIGDAALFALANRPGHHGQLHIRVRQQRYSGLALNHGEDGSVISRNVRTKRALAGQQNGNGINIFRAGGVLIEATITIVPTRRCAATRLRTSKFWKFMSAHR